MNRSLTFKRRLYNYIFLLISFFIFLYITYFLIYSDRGIIKYFILKNDLNNKTLTYNEILTKNEKLKDDINRLKLDDLDLDYLDELNVKHNGYIGSKDIIVVFPEN